MILEGLHGVWCCFECFQEIHGNINICCIVLHQYSISFYHTYEHSLIKNIVSVHISRQTLVINSAHLLSLRLLDWNISLIFQFCSHFTILTRSLFWVLPVFLVYLYITLVSNMKPMKLWMSVFGKGISSAVQV